MTIQAHLALDVAFFFVGVFLCLNARNFWAQWLADCGIACWDDSERMFDIFHLKFAQAILVWAAGLFLIGYAFFAVPARIISHLGS